MAKRTVVNSQMPNPMKVSTTQAPGQYGHNNPPFEAPQSMGNGGVPTKFYDTTITKPSNSTRPVAVDSDGTKSTTSPSSNMMAPGQVSPSRAQSRSRAPRNNRR